MERGIAAALRLAQALLAFDRMKRGSWRFFFQRKMRKAEGGSLEG